MSSPFVPRDPAGGTEAAHDVLEGATGGLDPRGTGGGVAVAPGDTDRAGPPARRSTVPPLSDRTRLEARQIMARYPRTRSALLPMLHLVQSEQGYITPQGVAMCAEELGLTKAEVGAVATFYTMYKRRPTGEYLVSVCTNTLCNFLGGEEIFAAMKDHLGVGHDQTTADGLITLEHAECLAACDYAPVVTVNYEFYDQQDTASAMNLIRDLQAGQRPAPTRGAPLASFRDVSRELAGFGAADVISAGVAGFSAGEPTLAGMRVALERGHESPAFDASTPVARPVDDAGAADTAAPASSTSSRPAQDAPAAGDTAHAASADRAQAAASTPAEKAGADMADPDKDQATKEKAQPGATDGTAPRDDEPQADEAEATGAPTGPGAAAGPQARRSRTRTRGPGNTRPTEKS